MALGDILTADVSSIGPWLRQGWSWWTEELALLLPERWRRASTVLAEPTGDAATPFRVTRNGQPVPAGQAPTAVSLVLPAADVLMRTLPVPAGLTRSDLRRMLSLEVPRLTPLRAEVVFLDVERSGADEATLAIVPRERVQTLFAEARDAGFAPTAVRVFDGAKRTRFDFLPAMRAAGALPAPATRRARWWAVVTLFALLNLVALIVRDVRATQNLADALGAQTSAVASATEARLDVEREVERRAALVLRRRASEPLAALAALSVALPDGAWVQRYAWTGRSVRMIGFKPGALDVPAALRRSPMFRNPRAATSDLPAPSAAAEPFDVTAELAYATAAP